MFVGDIGGVPSNDIIAVGREQGDGSVGVAEDKEWVILVEAVQLDLGEYVEEERRQLEDLVLQVEEFYLRVIEKYQNGEQWEQG